VTQVRQQQDNLCYSDKRHAGSDMTAGEPAGQTAYDKTGHQGERKFPGTLGGVHGRLQWE
jgi:hypothetical protein